MVAEKFCERVLSIPILVAVSDFATILFFNSLSPTFFNLIDDLSKDGIIRNPEKTYGRSLPPL